MTSWHHRIGLFEIWRLFLCYCILLLLFILCTNKKASAVGSGVWVKCFRTWVRIPGPPISSHYFSFRNCMRLQSQGPPYDLTIQSAKCPEIQIQRPSTKDHDTPSQTHGMGCKESTWVNPSWARKLLSTSPNCSCPITLSLFFFALFNLVYLFTNTK